MPYDDGVSDDIGGLDEQGLGLRRRGLLTPPFLGVGTADFPEAPPISRAPIASESNGPTLSARPRLGVTGADNPDRKLGSYPRPNLPQPAGTSADIPEAPPINIGGAPGGSTEPIPTSVAPPVKPPGFSDRYRDWASTEPQRNDPQFKVPTWKKALGIGLAGIASGFSPNHPDAGTLYRGISEGPYNRAEQAWEKKGGEIQKEAGLADTEAQMREREEKAELERAKANQPAKRQYENINQLHADAVQDAISRGVDPSKDPKVQQIEDSIQRTQKESAPRAGTPHTVETGRGVFQYNPDTDKYDIYVGPPKREARDPNDETPAQKLARTRMRNQAEREKGEGLRWAEDDIRKRYGLTGFAANEPWPQEATDELTEEKQRIQDEYEAKLGNLGADVTHFDYRAQNGAPTGQGAHGNNLDRQNPEHQRIAKQILDEAGGDVEKARQIARRRGYKF